MAIISYAQNFEDIMLNRVFASVNYGFYVDVGANDPVENSVTKTFYDRGWSGINIEPSRVFQRLADARPRDINLNIALLDYEGLGTLTEEGTDLGLSHVTAPVDQIDEASEAAIRVSTLTRVIREHAPRREIGFIKIDVEGGEHAIVRSTDWRIIRPTVLVIEATLICSNKLSNQEWEPLLLESGYVRSYFDGINCFYVPEERADLLQHFEVPINVLDNFVRFDASRTALEVSAQDLTATKQRLENLLDTLHSLESTHASLLEEHLHLTLANKEALDSIKDLDAVKATYNTLSAAHDALAADYATATLKLDRLEKIDETHSLLQKDYNQLLLDHESQRSNLASLLDAQAQLAKERDEATTALHALEERLESLQRVQAQSELEVRRFDAAHHDLLKLNGRLEQAYQELYSSYSELIDSRLVMEASLSSALNEHTQCQNALHTLQTAYRSLEELNSTLRSDVLNAHDVHGALIDEIELLKRSNSMLEHSFRTLSAVAPQMEAAHQNGVGLDRPVTNVQGEHDVGYGATIVHNANSLSADATAAPMMISQPMAGTISSTISAQPPRPLGKRILRPIYRVARVISRPFLRRLRAYLINDVREDIRAIHTELMAISDRSPADGTFELPPARRVQSIVQFASRETRHVQTDMTIASTENISENIRGSLQ
jgi:FkbM family methyltransferase